MWFASRSYNRRSSMFGERRRAHGSHRQPTSFCPQTEALGERWLLSTLTVTNVNDSGAGSLRAEIAAAHNNVTIVFDPSLDGQTITLTRGELVLNKSLTVQGPGAGSLAISGGGFSRMLEVDQAKKQNVTVSGLTITGGSAGAGGAILNYGKLTVTSSTLSGNSANQGGAICNAGNLTLGNCTLSGNTAPDAGGGGAIFNACSATISNSTLSGNAAEPYYDGTSEFPGYGGAIYANGGSLSLSNSTVSDNTANQGGYGSAIYMAYPSSKVSVTGCTVTDNNLSDYDLIWVDSGSLTVKDSYFHSANHTYISGPYTDGRNTFA